MAQLPPKIPTIPQNWPCFPHQRVPSSSIMSNTTTTATTTIAATITTTSDQQNSPSQQNQQQQLSWIDEFLDFSSVRRGAHRRSASDSIAFLETPFLEECRSGGSGSGGGFDRLDDDQLISMFSDDVTGVSFPPPSSTSNPSSPSSDQNSNNNNNNEEKPVAMAMDSAPSQENFLLREVKPKDEAVDDEALPAPPSSAGTINFSETVVDPKRVKRILANRQSAQRSRVRKLQYISELERSVSTLQTEVSALSPRVAFLDHQRLILNVDNSSLKQRIAALAQDKLFKDAHQEALKKEIERLRHIYNQQQNIQKMNNNNGHSLQHFEACKDKEQLLS